MFWRQKTNKNIIRIQISSRIQIQIWFACFYWPNTSTNNIQFFFDDWLRSLWHINSKSNMNYVSKTLLNEYKRKYYLFWKVDWIWISFGLKISYKSEYIYHSVFEKYQHIWYSNTFGPNSSNIIEYQFICSPLFLLCQWVSEL